MCEPISMGTALSLGTTVASTAYGMAEQSRYASWQSSIQRANQERANAAAMENYKFQVSSIQNQYIENERQASDQLEDAELERMRMTDSAKVAAGAAGVTGNSVDSLISNINEQGYKNIHKIEQNLESAQTQLGRDAVNIQRGTSNQLSTTAVYKPAAPALGAALKIGGAAMGSLQQSGFFSN